MSAHYCGFPLNLTNTFVKPNLWLMVNPNIVCPIQYTVDTVDLQTLCGAAEEIQTLETQSQQLPAVELRRFDPDEASIQEQLLLSVSSTNYMIQNEDISCHPARNRRRGRKTKDNKSLVKPSCWPRPPVNYCILIALALKSSHAGSLKVQQIYNFIREHFPFFQTAPDGWKNTIRHNLCFNSSFRKTCNQLGRDGKRKSCFWHLTLDGQQRLNDEINTMTGESLHRLEKSMSHPDKIRSILTL
ncbi:hypothetical protein INR49_022824 [Caranx melampygus]|nr:hypothetical protein INR49_022824 [Caranx melampygus]